MAKESGLWEYVFTRWWFWTIFVVGFLFSAYHNISIGVYYGPIIFLADVSASMILGLIVALPTYYIIRPKPSHSP